MTKDPVKSHNQEYSSRSFLLLTSSIISISNPMLMIMATILTRIFIGSSLLFTPTLTLPPAFAEAASRGQASKGEGI
jgi:hypothetical protein